jgi:argininosuccinate synthase
MLKWLKQEYNCEVIAYAADVGQAEELDGLREKAIRTGASKVYIEDLRNEFVSDYVFTALKANAIYEGCYLMGTSLARPIIAKRHVEIAHMEGADAVAHGATGKGNDQVRFELTYNALDPSLQVVAPWRTWEFKSRTDLMQYARSNGIPVAVSAAKPYSMDRNLMHISYEGGILEDPWNEPPDDIFLLTENPETASNTPEYVDIDFKDGIPVAVNDEAMSPAQLLSHLNQVGGSHGVGRVDLVENRFVGMKSRGVYETPGMSILGIAHRALESITMDREVMHLRDSLNTKISELIYYGFWFSPEFKLLRSFIDESQVGVSGCVRLKLYKGNSMVVGRRSPNSLYSEALATFEEDQVYDQSDATGFIALNSLRLKLGNGLESVSSRPTRQLRLIASS